jgi:hypothetical protein
VISILTIKTGVHTHTAQARQGAAAVDANDSRAVASESRKDETIDTGTHQHYWFQIQQPMHDTEMKQHT